MRSFSEIAHSARWRFDLSLAKLDMARRARWHLSGNKHRLNGDLIVSLTSFPPRFPTIALTIQCLLDQSIAPDKIILWIASEDFQFLPREVLDMRNDVFCIELCDNIRSYKKLIPALIKYPSAFIVTADDDVFYPRGWLQGLLGAALETPNAIVGWRAHEVRLDKVNGAPLPYNRWRHGVRRFSSDSKDRVFLVGVGGILYPPNSLHREVTDVDTFMRLAPRADDIWFYVMSRLANSARRKVDGDFRTIPWPGSQDFSLSSHNAAGTGNDEQFRALLEMLGDRISF